VSETPEQEQFRFDVDDAMAMFGNDREAVSQELIRRGHGNTPVRPGALHRVRPAALRNGGAA
jgi:hypothetical protein